MTAAHGALYVFYSIHLVAQGYGKALVGLLWTLGVVAEIVVFLLMPRISLRVSMRAILLVCFVLAALRFLVIGWAADFIWLLVLAQLLHGASFGAPPRGNHGGAQPVVRRRPAGAGTGAVRQRRLWRRRSGRRLAGRRPLGKGGCRNHLHGCVRACCSRADSGLARGFPAIRLVCLCDN
jgi:MFS family permease